MSDVQKILYVQDEGLYLPAILFYLLYSTHEKYSNSLSLILPRKVGIIIECHCVSMFQNWSNKIQNLKRK